MPNLKRNIAIAVVLCAGLAPRALAEEAPPLPGELGVAADHHLHLRSALGRDAMVAANELLGEELRVDGIDADRPILLARDIVRELDAAGIRKGTVLSEAYLAGMPELVAVHDDAEARTRALNDLTFDEVRRFPARLVGFCSVNPLLEFAEQEVERCADELAAVGLKLHLANSDVSLRSAADLERLQSVLATAATHRLAVVVHLRTRDPAYGRQDVLRFAHDVLARVSSLELYIAHLGGWGGFDGNTLDALTTWAELLEDETFADRHDVGFDLAATVTRHPSESNGDIARLIERIGPERFYLGSDWPAHNQPRWVPVNVVNQLSLDDTAMKILLTNQAGYFDR